MPLNNPGKTPPTFHELDGSVTTSTPGTSSGWIDWDLSATVPGNCLVEVYSQSPVGMNMGVRVKGSALNVRYVSEITNNLPIFQHCLTDTNGKIQVHDDSSPVAYHLAGYWS